MNKMVMSFFCRFSTKTIRPGVNIVILDKIRFNPPVEPTYVLEIECDPLWTDAVAARLFDMGLRGLETVAEHPRALLRTYCDSEDSARLYAAGINDYADAMRALWPEADAWNVRIRSLGSVDWANAWKAYFKPAAVTDRIVVRPSWEEYLSQPGEIVLVVDPKMAFGTGTHETTGMGLAAVQRWAESGWLTADSAFLDLGCGTGILAIAALVFGATGATAVDIDPVAVECARENAGLNGVAERLDARVGGLECVSDSYDLILANIDAPTLVPMAARLAQHLRPNGRLAVTGLLVDGAKAVAEQLVRAGLSRVDEFTRGEWRLSEWTRQRP